MRVSEKINPLRVYIRNQKFIGSWNNQKKGRLRKKKKYEEIQIRI